MLPFVINGSFSQITSSDSSLVSSRTVSTLRYLRRIFLVFAKNLPLILITSVSAIDSSNDAATQKMLQEAAYENDMKYAKEISQQEPFSESIEFAKHINEQQKHKVSDLQNIAKDLEFVTGKLPVIGGGCKDCESKIQNIPNKETDIENGIIVFVSFSMPKAALIELSDQSQKYGATLVLRGIHEDSFVATKDKILEINPKGLQLDIHPDLFKQYDIKRVPTFVLVKNGKEVSRLSGNVTLEFAHSKLMEVQ